MSEGVSRGLRRKVLGVRLRIARQQHGLSAAEVSALTGIPAQVLGDMELGRCDLSLPQAEMLSMVYGVPLEALWADEEPKRPDLGFSAEVAMALRRRIIGVLLRQAREESGRSLEEVAAYVGCSSSEIADAELGRCDLSLFDLQRLAIFLGIPFERFLEEGLAQTIQQPARAEGNGQEQPPMLPPEMQQFLADPVNLPFLRLAMQLAELPASTLRKIAEELLEISH